MYSDVDKLKNTVWPLIHLPYLNINKYYTMEICRVEYSILFLLMLCTIWSICLDLELLKMKDDAVQESCPLYSPLIQGQGCFLSQLLLAPIALARCKKILKTKENPDWVLKDTFSMSYNLLLTRSKVKAKRCRLHEASSSGDVATATLLQRCQHVPWAALSMSPARGLATYKIINLLSGLL